MDKLSLVRSFLDAIGMPKKQQSDVCCYTILAMAGIRPKTSWAKASNAWIRIHDIIQFINQYYRASYAENSRETFRKQALHAFREATIVEDNGLATNSPNYRYRITEETLSVLRCLESASWLEQVNLFLAYHDRLVDKYVSKKSVNKQFVKINGVGYSLSTGLHNKLQKLIIEEFVPRFAPDVKCLYLGDTADKALVKDAETLKTLGFDIAIHDKLPDIVLYSQPKKWLYFIEAVTSVGPMTPQRILDIKSMIKNVELGAIYVTAFMDLKTYKKFITELAWETEVWIAELPDHMIHLNGDKFMGPR